MNKVLLAILLFSGQAFGQRMISLDQTNSFAGDMFIGGKVYGYSISYTNQLSADFNARSLFGINGAQTVDFSGGFGALDTAGFLIINGSAGVRTLNDASTGNTSVDFDIRQLLATDGTTITADWQAKALYGAWSVSTTLTDYGTIIKSNAVSSIPALSNGDVFMWSSNGVLYAICKNQSSVQTTNKLAP